MDIGNIEVSFFIEDHQSTIQSDKSSWDKQTMNEIAAYIINELKKKYQTDVFRFRDIELAHHSLEEIVAFQIKHSFMTIPHNHTIQTFPTTENRQARQVYLWDGQKVKIEKYKGTRKTETAVFELSTIRNINKQYEQTFKQFLDKNLDQGPSKNSEGDESPKFGGGENKATTAQRKLKEFGNDGMTQVQFIKRDSLKTKIELKPITIQEVAQHRTENDAWIVINGKVYDVTYYLNYHPGGKAKLMEGVGMDGTVLFCNKIFKQIFLDQHHSWVNAHYLLERYQVGYLVNKIK